MKKKLVLLSAFLSPYRSGAEAMVEEVAVRLTLDFDITIITGRYSRALPREDTLPPSPAPPPNLRPPETGFGRQAKGERGNDVRASGSIRIIRVGLGYSFDKWLYPFLAPMRLGGLRPDVIHAVLETFAGLALWMCRCKALKVLTLQTTNRTFLKKMILRHPDKITAISEDLRRIALSFGRTDVTVIPNGIDLVALQKARETFLKDATRVLFVGRLEPMKGIDTLLRAFALAVLGQSPHVHVRIVGDGSEAPALKKLAVELQIDHRVTFVGRITGEQLFEEYARAEIFCGLSRSEALGNVFLEAQAAGCAVLATNVGGIPEIVLDGVTGILVPPDDVEAAAFILKQFLEDVPLRTRLATEARRHAEAYGWDNIAKRYAALLSAEL